jgi:hypothetical protein
MSQRKFYNADELVELMIPEGIRGKTIQSAIIVYLIRKYSVDCKSAEEFLSRIQKENRWAKIANEKAALTYIEHRLIEIKNTECHCHRFGEHSTLLEAP